MRRRRLQIVGGKDYDAALSDLSREEEARALKLADIALHNPTESNDIEAGSRAQADFHQSFENLKREAEVKPQLKTRVA